MHTDEELVDRALAQHSARFREQVAQHRARTTQDPDAMPLTQQVQCVFVWRSALWQWLGVVAVGKPSTSRVAKWRRRFGVRKGEVMRVVAVTKQIELTLPPTAARTAPVPSRVAASHSATDNVGPLYTLDNMPSRVLVAACCVVPEQVQGRPWWSAVALGAGSVVKLAPNARSAVTGLANELRVQWADCVGRVSFGWLASTAKGALSTRVGPSEQEPRYASSVDQRLSAWDAIRYKIGRTEGWRVKDWVITFSSRNTPLLHAAIAELGGTVPASNDPATASHLLLTLTTHTRSSTMSTATELTDAPATKPKRTSSKKAPVVTTLATGAGTTKRAKASSKRTKEAPTTKKAKRTKVAEPEGQAGRVSMYAGKVIVKLVDENPRREGTHGFNSWKLLRKNMTYEQYITAGGRREDLAWDLLKGNCKVVRAPRA